MLPLTGLLVVFARERDARIDQALALSTPTAAPRCCMGDVLEADDAYTGGEHSHGVVALALAVGDEIGLDARERRDLEFARAAARHRQDRASPNEIINKPGKLPTRSGRSSAATRPTARRCSSASAACSPRSGASCARHHERWDGRGYPDGIAGEAIPLAARIICACDAYSAMTTNRSYRAAHALAEARSPSCERCSGSQFDPAVVQALLRTVAKHPEHRPARALLELAA